MHDEELTQAVRRCVRIYRAGGKHALSRSAKSLMQNKLADVTESTIDILRSLQPTAKDRLPALPEHCAPDVVTLDQLGNVLKHRIDNGAAPGPSGWTGSHLMLIWQGGSPEAKKGLTLLIRDICNGVYSGEIQQRLLACRLIPLAKPNNGIRPVAVGEVFTKCAAHCMMARIADELPALFPAIQYGVQQQGGSETAVQLIRSSLHEIQQLRSTNPSTIKSPIIALTTDFKNAFNSIFRVKVWEALLANKKTEPIWKAFHWQYSTASPLLVYSRSGELFAELKSSEGTRQGCPFAGFGFALTVQPLYAGAKAQTQHCQAISIQDDLTLVGPADEVLKAFDYIQKEAPALGLALQTHKCKVYLPPELQDEQEIRTVGEECDTRGLKCHRKIEALGVTFGTDTDIEAHCAEIVESHRGFFAALTHPEMPKQVAFSLLRYCGLPRLGYLARTVPPNQLKNAAREFDLMAKATALELIGCGAPNALGQLESKEGDPDRKKDGSTDRASLATSEQIWTRASLSLAKGGLGIRPVSRILHAGYFASLLQALPDFLLQFPHLADTARSEFASAILPRCQLFRDLTTSREVLVKLGALNGRDARRTAQQQQPERDPCPRNPDRSPFPALQKSIEQIWIETSADLSGGKGIRSASIPLNKLQHAITVRLENAIYAKLYSSCQLYQQTIMNATTNSKENTGSSAFLSVLANEPGYRMSDEHFVLAVRHRLGLLPYDDEPTAEFILSSLRLERHWHPAPVGRSGPLPRMYAAQQSLPHHTPQRRRKCHRETCSIRRSNSVPRAHFSRAEFRDKAARQPTRRPPHRSSRQATIRRCDGDSTNRDYRTAPSWNQQPGNTARRSWRSRETQTSEIRRTLQTQRLDDGSVRTRIVRWPWCTLIRTVQLVSETRSLCSAPFVDLRHPSPFQHVSSFHIIN
jgi:hypothetical protein